MRPRRILVTKANIGADGGPQNIFDSGKGYRNKLKAIRGHLGRKVTAGERLRRARRRSREA